MKQVLRSSVIRKTSNESEMRKRRYWNGTSDGHCMQSDKGGMQLKRRWVCVPNAVLKQKQAGETKQNKTKLHLEMH